MLVSWIIHLISPLKVFSSNYWEVNISFIGKKCYFHISGQKLFLLLRNFLKNKRGSAMKFYNNNRKSTLMCRLNASDLLIKY